MEQFQTRIYVRSLTPFNSFKDLLEDDTNFIEQAVSDIYRYLKYLVSTFDRSIDTSIEIVEGKTVETVDKGIRPRTVVDDFVEKIEVLLKECSKVFSNHSTMAVLYSCIVICMKIVFDYDISISDILYVGSELKEVEPLIIEHCWEKL